MNKTKYICTYCGVSETENTLSFYALERKRCKTCNNDKFELKKIPDDVNYYEGDPEPDDPVIEHDYD